MTQAACKHNKGHIADVRVACFEDRPGSFMAEIRINCADCGKAFQFHGMNVGIDTHGASVSVDGQEARIAISPEGSVPSPMQRMAFNVSKFDG